MHSGRWALWCFSSCCSSSKYLKSFISKEFPVQNVPLLVYELESALFIDNLTHKKHSNDWTVKKEPKSGEVAAVEPGHEGLFAMSRDHDFSCFVFLINFLIFFDFFLFKLIAVMFFVIHVDSSFFKFFDGNVIFDKPVAVIFEVNNVIDGNIQKPYHDVESFLVNFHDIVHP